MLFNPDMNKQAAEVYFTNRHVKNEKCASTIL